jgi:general secretion pathway protein F
MLFEVRALSTDNRIATFVVDALNETTARDAALERAYKVLAVRPAGRTAARGRGASFSLVLFAQELLALIEAGLSIVEALESMQEKTTPGITRDVSAGLAHALKSGQRFSQALASRPEYFPPLFVGLIQAAETTSDLPSALSRFVDFETRLASVRNKTISAAIYPMILLVVGGGVTFFLLGYVVPRFATVYEDAGRQMSFLTSLLLQWGRFVASHTALLLGIVAGLIVLGVIVWRVVRERFTITDLLAHLPGVRLHAQQYELSRLYVTTGLLLQGGIPLVRALSMVQATVGARTRQRLMRAIPRISAGEPFSAAMAGEDLAGPVAVRLFRVGEQAGNLGEMLVKTARFYDAEVTRFIDRFTRAAEPILMAAIGLVVGTIVVLLYMPIFELAGSLQ